MPPQAPPLLFCLSLLMLLPPLLLLLTLGHFVLELVLLHVHRTASCAVTCFFFDVYSLIMILSDVCNYKSTHTQPDKKQSLPVFLTENCAMLTAAIEMKRETFHLA